MFSSFESWTETSVSSLTNQSAVFISGQIRPQRHECLISSFLILVLTKAPPCLVCVPTDNLSTLVSSLLYSAFIVRIVLLVVKVFNHYSFRVKRCFTFWYSDKITICKKGLFRPVWHEPFRLIFICIKLCTTFIHTFLTFRHENM